MLRQLGLALLASSFTATAADPALPAGWELVRNSQNLLTGAVYFPPGSPLLRASKKTAKYFRSDVLYLAYQHTTRSTTEAMEVAERLRAAIEAEGRAIRVVFHSSCESAVERSMSRGELAASRAKLRLYERATKESRAWTEAPPDAVILPARAQRMADRLGLPVIGEIPIVEGQEVFFRGLYIIENYAHGIAHEADEIPRQKLFTPGSKTPEARPPVPIPFRRFFDDYTFDVRHPGAAGSNGGCRFTDVGQRQAS